MQIKVHSHHLDGEADHSVDFHVLCSTFICQKSSNRIGWLVYIEIIHIHSYTLRADLSSSHPTPLQVEAAASPGVERKGKMK